MDEIFKALFLIVNLPYTILLGFTMMYWTTIILGFIDVEAFDVDTETDVEIELNADIDGGLFKQILLFFNIGEIPIMVLFNIFTIFLWFFGLTANHYLNASNSIFISVIILVPNFLVSAMFTKYCSIPFKKLFKALNSGTEHEEVIGQIGVVTSLKITEEYGQIELLTGESGVVKLNVVCDEGDEFNKGDEVIVYSTKDNKDDLFIVTKSDINRIGD
ncbi:MAG: hypothetical protein COA79_12115 [Planctomycetota bacterium]|nr:MAG: hypothetical protein COA79_12115 [Planctomycetota bacterium]